MKTVIRIFTKFSFKFAKSTTLKYPTQIHAICTHGFIQIYQMPDTECQPPNRHSF